MSDQMHNEMSQAPDVLTRRPGLVTFAAIMLFILAAFQIVFAISEFANAAWITGSTYGTFGGYLWLWAILDLLLAFIPLYAGYDLLQGGSFGFIVGIVLAAISAIRWFFYLPAQPILALVVISIDVLIIYGLTSSADYFRASAARRSGWPTDTVNP
jgi:hypothetical protein